MIVYTIIVFLPQYELKEMTIPEYFRTQEEIRKPFMSDESPVRKAGLKLVWMEIKEFPLPEKKLFLETGDAKIAARFMTEQTRAWSNSMFLSGKSNGKLDVKSILVLKGSRPEKSSVKRKHVRKHLSSLSNLKNFPCMLFMFGSFSHALNTFYVKASSTSEQ